MYYQENRYYNTKKISTDLGQWDSKFEAGYAQELVIRKKTKDIKDYKEQVVLDLNVNGYCVCTYKIDFIVYHNDSTVEYIETKGYPTPVWRLKWKLFCALYENKPNLKLTVIYQGKNRFKPPKPRRIKE